MLKNYFKQAWTLMRQNLLFTGIYVVGTGLSIALVMTLFIIFYVKFGPVYPEYNRDRTLVLKPIKRYPKDKPESWCRRRKALQGYSPFCQRRFLECLFLPFF